MSELTSADSLEFFIQDCKKKLASVQVSCRTIIKNLIFNSSCFVFFRTQFLSCLSDFKFWRTKKIELRRYRCSNTSRVAGAGRSRGFWLEPEFSPGSGSYSYSTVL